jgi:serine/threonine-protein kinase RsbW
VQLLRGWAGAGVVVIAVVLELPTSAWTVAVARHALYGLLDAAGVVAAIREDLALALSEGCSNAVRHGSAGLSYRVQIDLNPSRCRLEIRDQGPGFDPHLLPPRTPDTDGGRGLLIMRTVVDHVQFDVLRPHGMKIVMVKSWHHPFRARREDDRVLDHDQRAEIV